MQFKFSSEMSDREAAEVMATLLHRVFSPSTAALATAGAPQEKRKAIQRDHD
jgi:hypothetical protein